MKRQFCQAMQTAEYDLILLLKCSVHEVHEDSNKHNHVRFLKYALGEEKSHLLNIPHSKVSKTYIRKTFFLNSVLCPFQDYFSSYETGQSVGGAKTGEPREKPPETPASRTWLVSHVASAGLEPTPGTVVR